MGFKEWWKEKPLWIKIGMILVLLDILNISSLLISNRPFTTFADSITMGLIVLHIPLSWLYLSIASIQVENPVSLISFIIVGLTNTFLIGALIGWLVSKFKSK